MQRLWNKKPGVMKEKGKKKYYYAAHNLLL
jgi:hypothetical protein